MSSFSHLFPEVYPVFDISILDRNSSELFQSYQCLKIFSSRYRCLQSPFYWLVPLPLPLLFSVLFVDNLQVCTPKAVCSFVWLCVQHGHRECICTDVRFDFQSPCPFFFIFQTFSFSFSYSGFSNHRGSLLPHSRVKCSFFVICYLLLLLCTFTSRFFSLDMRSLSCTTLAFNFIL